MPETVPPRDGVLLINLGTPDAPTPAAVRRYLGEFLRDRRVIQLPRLVWWPILYGLVLPFRAPMVAQQYARIWRSDGSPLRALTRELRLALEMPLARLVGRPVVVSKAMRYGQPDIPSALAKFQQLGLERVVVLPLYPQYSATTTASVLDVVEDWFGRSLWRPELHIVEHYHDDPGYIAALADSVREHWAVHGRAPLVMSFHGIPQRYVDQGDPYASQCRETAALLARVLGLGADDWDVTYQSRFGRAQWLQPYTDQALRLFARGGIRTLDVICPGFAVDCLETLEEIAVRYAALFVKSGGEALRYVPALNAQPAHVDALARIVAARLAH